eukprot:TRINITY_DN511_c0_g9_i1.p1 TRINITY_DN511_c0_g9~~TRINITY_DN511_c0_g9_i1.p1  ORF type:complete len:441 (+),score=134.39 TRINITY_DN511_c0_g9_i1:51-1373(+)
MEYYDSRTTETRHHSRDEEDESHVGRTDLKDERELKREKKMSSSSTEGHKHRHSSSSRSKHVLKHERKDAKKRFQSLTCVGDVVSVLSSLFPSSKDDLNVLGLRIDGGERVDISLTEDPYVYVLLKKLFQMTGMRRSRKHKHQWKRTRDTPKPFSDVCKKGSEIDRGVERVGKCFGDGERKAGMGFSEEKKDKEPVAEKLCRLLSEQFEGGGRGMAEILLQLEAGKPVQFHAAMTSSSKSVIETFLLELGCDICDEIGGNSKGKSYTLQKNMDVRRSLRDRFAPVLADTSSNDPEFVKVVKNVWMRQVHPKNIHSQTSTEDDQPPYIIVPRFFNKIKQQTTAPKSLLELHEEKMMKESSERKKDRRKRREMERMGIALSESKPSAGTIFGDRISDFEDGWDYERDIGTRQLRQTDPKSMMRGTGCLDDRFRMGHQSTKFM